MPEELKAVFALRELMHRAADLKGITFSDGSRSILQSRTIASCRLDGATLQALLKDGFVCRKMEDTFRIRSAEGDFSAVLDIEDGSPLTLGLYVEFSFEEGRGIRLWGKVSAKGTSWQVPGHQKIFRCLVRCGSGMPPVAREIAEAPGGVLVKWQEMGMDNPPQLLDSLFSDFCKGKDKKVGTLADMGVFSPNPYPGGSGLERRFARYPRMILTGWELQLREFAAKILSYS